MVASTSPVKKFKSAENSTGIPASILAKVYKKSMKKSGRSAQASEKVKYFIKNGCTFKLYPELVNQALNKMSQPNAKKWCERQIKRKTM